MDFLQTECTYGEFSNLIVPPNWITKSNEKKCFESNLFTYLSSSKCNQEKKFLKSIENKSLPVLSSPNEIINNFGFIIRPISYKTVSTIKNPLLVIINPKSGGKLGPRLLKKFTWFLNPRQIFEIGIAGSPKFP